MKIDSLNNERVKNWTKLNNKKYRDETGLFLVEGDHLVTEAIKSHLVTELIILEGTEFKTALPYVEVSAAVMKKITNQVSISNVCAVCKKIEEKEVTGNVVILDDIQDPGNFGTIIRSAIAFNIDTIVVSPNTVDLYNPKVIRSSEGMVFHINVVKRDISSLIDELHERNYCVYGTKVDDGKVLKGVSKTTPYAVIMGNEGSGVKSELLSKCDEHLYIPMNEVCESLNVGVATSIILYELF
ncbi:MAG: RNA methyltransferase [Bacilli bacterium]|nr:RNA methyltransferase [Bacilli bacterium]